jgi:hypothetical protein
MYEKTLLKERLEQIMEAVVRRELQEDRQGNEREVLREVSGY